VADVEARSSGYAVLFSDEDIVIARDGPPVVRLAPVVGTSSLAARGAWRGRADEFPDELAEASCAR
jgi:antitoxin (DNA-binding transcriptional repressor) of toxin-antitoxin stability system